MPSVVATCISSGLVRELAAWGERAAQASKGSVKVRNPKVWEEVQGRLCSAPS